MFKSALSNLVETSPTKNKHKKHTNNNNKNNPMTELSFQSFIDLTKGCHDSDDAYKQTRQNKIVQNAIHWALVNGFIVVPRGLNDQDLMAVTYLPFTLYPTTFRRKAYQKIDKLQPEINTLMYKIANSHKYMENNFKELANIDRFISSLWSIYQKSLTEGYNQKIFLQILRVDYMLHQTTTNSNEDAQFKQVEINTMASGMGYNSGKITQLHAQILRWSGYSHLVNRLPSNEPVKLIARGFVEAWRMYNVKKSIVLFIVLEWEVNLGDQRNTEYEIVRQEEEIEVKRCTLKEMHQFGWVDENKVLYFDNREVAIVYFRAGYAPSHYESEKEWTALTMIELSKAIKCPNVATFLAGMKKVQEFLYHDKRALLELCNNEQDLSDSHRSVFADFLKLDSKDDFEKIYNNPNNYVLKPQREGGGNNYYKNEIKEILSNMLDKRELNDSEDEMVTSKKRYIVMELLKAPVTKNIIINPKSQQKLAATANLLHVSKITNELGIFGILVRNENEIVLNESCGYLLRSKLAEENEGGLMAGSGALDSICFID